MNNFKNKNLNIIITGGGGFIDSSLIRLLLSSKNLNILNINKITYDFNLNSRNNMA